MDLYLIKIYNTDIMLSYCIDVQKALALMDTVKLNRRIPLLYCSASNGYITDKLFAIDEINRIVLPGSRYRIAEQLDCRRSVNIVGMELFLLVTNSFVDEAIEASKVFIHSMHTEMLQKITSGRAYYPPEIFVIRSQ